MNKLTDDMGGKETAAEPRSLRGNVELFGKDVFLAESSLGRAAEAVDFAENATDGAAGLVSVDTKEATNDVRASIVERLGWDDSLLAPAVLSAALDEAEAGLAEYEIRLAAVGAAAHAVAHDLETAAALLRARINECRVRLHDDLAGRF